MAASAPKAHLPFKNEESIPIPMSRNTCLNVAPSKSPCRLLTLATRRNPENALTAAPLKPRGWTTCQQNHRSNMPKLEFNPKKPSAAKSSNAKNPPKRPRKRVLCHFDLAVGQKPAPKLNPSKWKHGPNPARPPHPPPRRCRPSCPPGRWVCPAGPGGPPRFLVEGKVTGLPLGPDLSPDWFGVVWLGSVWFS